MARKWRILLLVSVGSFMAFLDAPVVSIAYPAIRNTFPGVLPTTLAWTLDVYFIGFAATLVIAGKIADRYGRQRVFLFGLGLFALASAVCGATPSVGVLIAARAAQSIAAAMVIPAGQGIMLTEFSPQERKMAIGVLAAVVGLATALSPTIGSVIVSELGWRWIFYLNVAVAVGATAYAIRLLRADEPVAQDAPFPDAFGAMLQAAALTLLVLGILKSPDWGLGGARTLTCFAIAAVALPLFIARSRRHAAPVLDLDLFRNRTFTAANVSSFLLAIAFYGSVIEAVLYLTTIWRWSILDTGLAFIPGALIGAIVGAPAGRLAERYGSRWISVIGSLVAGIGLALVALMAGSSSHYVSEWLPGQLIYSAGSVAALTGLVGAALTSAPPTAFALASGVNAAFRQVGGAIGVALVFAITSVATASTAVDRGHVAFFVAAASLFAGGLTALFITAPYPSTVSEPAAGQLTGEASLQEAP
jgi:EmrB/QacA subfamily drug resistance transporter